MGEMGRKITGIRREKRAWGWEEMKQVRDYGKRKGSWSWSSVFQLMELPSFLRGLLVICRDVSPPVVDLSHHIVQRALIRQPWPLGVLISIARGRGNPRQGPAGHLITTTASSSLHPYSLPSYVLTHCPSSLTHRRTHTQTHMSPSPSRP